MTARVERQIERFAPGFRDCVLERHTIRASEFAARNPNMVGGDNNGGANTLGQVLARPVWRYDPYATPNPRVFLCSSSTPPGGGSTACAATARRARRYAACCAELHGTSFAGRPNRTSSWLGLQLLGRWALPMAVVRYRRRGCCA